MSKKNKSFRKILLSASAIAGCFAVAAPALAQNQSGLVEGDKGSSAPAHAQAGNPEAIDVVVVTGSSRMAGGLMKMQTAAETMSSVTASAIQEKLANASPLQLAATLPGVNYGTSDAYGLSVRNFLSVRGLDETELGFMIENAPGTDLFSYFPFSEAWADNENISDITLTPGNSRLQDPIVSASGGEFVESIRVPRDKFGGTVSASAGSFAAWRAYGDIDTGYIGQTGVKALLSYSHTSARTTSGLGPAPATTSISRSPRIGRRMPIRPCFCPTTTW